MVPIEEVPQKDVDAPYVINDSMPDTYHHGVNMWFDSKRAYRAATKACGCVEIGDQKLPPRQKTEHISDRKLVDTIQRAWEQKR